MISQYPHSIKAMILIMALLIIASLSRILLKIKKPSNDLTELKLRTQSWWWMIALIFASLYIGKTTTIYFFAFLSFLALKEFLSITPVRQADRRVIFWLYLAIPIQYYFISINWYDMAIIFIPVYIFLFIPIRMVLIGKTEGFIRSAGLMNFAVMLTVFCISHLAYFIVLEPKNTQAGPAGLVLFLLFMTQFNDVSQYIWGKSFGKNKIVPKVSPNKTWEGFLGGVSTIVLVGYFLAPYLTPLSSRQGLIAGLIISLSGFFGDLVVSSVKRDLHIKDTGNLIPGHGGILDRMDSLIYTAPLFFHFIYYLYY
ncbi:phosphatidate cytidylyltransferase [Lentisphaera profundi]|uniref:Phosphatidate cytidylyltransferase n=1 Tax=Lentisphaera profundi TaxID=1658616 RepID=A0ABY7W0E4_9BACT|nr:phosphatidate cytidylyltransferase [Lentisphaera profundi]WDE98501.1 phosphatidate cytidylyltransferase [Lentisphaera profundi]